MLIKEVSFKIERLKNIITAIMEDGSEVELFSYFNDELSFNTQEFEGLTEEQAIQLFLDKDKAYLQS